MRASAGKGQMLTFEVSGEKQLDFAVTRVVREMRDMTPLWELFRTEFIAAEAEAFASGKFPEPTSESYIAWKARHYPGRPGMIASGALSEALMAPSVYRPAPRSLAIGAGGKPGEYGSYWQTGNNRAGRTVKVIDMDKGVMVRWARASEVYMRRLGNLWAAA